MTETSNSRILRATILILFQIYFACAAKLDRDGGYWITLTVDDASAKPQDVTSYLKTIEQSVEDLSSQMFRATKNRFFIKSVDIVVPYAWALDLERSLGFSNEVLTYHNSDIRVSSKVPRPRAQNRNQCGRPGEFVELPLTFFDSAEPYGTYWKALLNLWAQLRYGVYEESGHPGDHRFPYFYKHELNSKTEWQTTGCYNEELVGELVNIRYPTMECNWNDRHLYPPPSICRFEPDPIKNTAKKSLMSFQWIETVKDFCDSDSHNVRSPNRHNMFCGHRSVLEVIEDCEDATMLDVVRLPPPLPTTNFFKSTARPLLFILLDNGLHMVPPEQFVLVKSGLRDLMDGRIPENTRAKINVFPPNTESHPLPRCWSTLDVANKLEFDRFINNHEPDWKLDRDFPAAIKEAIEEINAKNPVSGGVLVVLKNGAKGNFGNFIHEQELISLVKGRPVKIFAIEMQENLLTPRINLEKLCKESGGGHLALTRNSDLEDAMKALVDSVVQVFTQPIVPVANIGYVLHKENVKPDERIVLPPSHRSFLPLRIILTTTANPYNITLNPEAPAVSFVKTKEWNEAGSKSRNSHSARLENLDESQSLELDWLEYDCEESPTGDGHECDGHLIIFGEDSAQNDVQIRITTSARNGIVNLDIPDTDPKPSDLILQFPLSIFVEVSEKDKPLKGLTGQTPLSWPFALVKQPDNSEQVEILRNNGQAPDLYPNDGIYSGVFVPKQTGTHTITVRFSYQIPSIFNSERDLSSRLMFPVDQNDATCGFEGSCDAEFPKRAMARSWDLLGSIEINVGLTPPQLPPVPAPILDLTYNKSDGYNFFLLWTSPHIIGTNGTVSADSYKIRWAETPEDLLQDKDVGEYYLYNPKLPGELESFEETVREVRYYSVTTVFDNIASLRSNIIGVYPEDVVIPTTTTTTQRSTTTEAPPTVTHGYHIVISIDEMSMSTVENPAEYIEMLKDGLQSFSQKMFEATTNRFYVHSVDMIVPNAWETEIFPLEETVISSNLAQIRISTNVVTPRVENPIPCGLPGTFIELPISFFNETTTPYGDPAKALLHQWTRYRWGAWEEHGFAGSQRFPYFHKQPTVNADWEPTGCSNPTMLGNITKPEGDEGECSLDGDLRPDVDCRFEPLEPNDAKSSLMYLHWVDSVDRFCNEQTHDRAAPNKQNLFCRHRSVFEIIQRSLDLDVNGELIDDPNAPSTEFHFKKTSQKPLLYFLLDEGQTPVPEESFERIRVFLRQFVIEKVPEDTMMALGKFPSTETEGSYVEEVLPWSVKNQTAFKIAIENYPSRTLAIRDFGLAILETVNKIKKLKLEAGAVVIVLKTGMMPNTFDRVSYEEEISASIKEHNIKMFVLEIRGSALRPNIHLQYLAQKSGGGHLTINNVAMIPGMEDIFTRSIGSELLESAVAFNSGTRVMFKGFVEPGDGLIMRVAPRDYSNILVHFTTVTGEILQADLNVTLERRVVKFKSKKEWGISQEQFSRETFYGNESTWNLGPSAGFTVSFKCAPTPPDIDCRGFLVVEGEFRHARQPDPIRIIVSTSTSALNNIVDLSQDRQSTTPFAVFVRVEENGRPLKGVENVEATFYLADKTNSWTIQLEDNGYGTPDTFRNDGVYSANFIPPADGTYNLFVSVQHASKTEEITSGTRNGRRDTQKHNIAHDADADNFLPIDQSGADCDVGQCNAKSPSANFARVIEFADPILVKNAELWNAKFVPQQILDLNAWALDDYNISLRWMSPFSIGHGDLKGIKAEKFEVGIAETLEQLTELNFENVPDTDRIQIIDDIEEPGKTQEFIFQDTRVDRTYYYFAIRSCYSGFCSRPSNIVGVLSRSEELPTEPPPTTTEEALETTLKPSTPSTSTTTARTTTTTTKKPTTTTIQTPSTTEEKIVYWYEKPEGYFTLSAFGGAILLLAIGAAIFVWLKNRSGTSEAKSHLIDSER